MDLDKLAQCDPGYLWKLLLVFIVVSLWEYWLGKTNRTRAGSTLELVLIGVIALALLILNFWRTKWKKTNNQQ